MLCAFLEESLPVVLLVCCWFAELSALGRMLYAIFCVLGVICGVED